MKSSMHTLKDRMQLRQRGQPPDYFDDGIALIPFLLMFLIALESDNFSLLRRLIILLEGTNFEDISIKTFGQSLSEVLHAI